MLLNEWFVINCLFICGTIYGMNENDHIYWKNLGESDIKRAINLEIIDKNAKNVILFVGDGMGVTTITTARIYGKTEKGYLAFEQFPHIGVMKTYSANKLVPDSCSTATALFCGVKANHKTAGVDASVAKDDCDASLYAHAQLESIMDWGQSAGKATGFVTTTRVTHATPAALYAHTPNREWECDARIPDQSRHCKDIARQLIENLPGRNLNVIMGGGRQCLNDLTNNINESDTIDQWACQSRDGRDLIGDWSRDKMQRQLRHAYVSNTGQLNEVNGNSIDYLLGIFANGHMKMEHERGRGDNGEPSLANMTRKAIEIVRKNSNGYILMIEGGMIDYAHHRGHARQALSETIAFSDAIETALELVDLNDTLIIVTSDHSHSLVFTGYPDRGQSVLDLAGKSPIDGIAYTSLLYGTGGANNYQFSINENSVIRRDPAWDDTETYDYSQQSVVLTDEVAHGGSDVLVYANGPMAHLFHTVHEQTYVAYVIAYATKIGPFTESHANILTATTSLFLLLLNLIIII